MSSCRHWKQKPEPAMREQSGTRAVFCSKHNSFRMAQRLLKEWMFNASLPHSNKRVVLSGCRQANDIWASAMTLTPAGDFGLLYVWVFLACMFVSFLPRQINGLFCVSSSCFRPPSQNELRGMKSAMTLHLVWRRNVTERARVEWHQWCSVLFFSLHQLPLPLNSTGRAWAVYQALSLFCHLELFRSKYLGRRRREVVRRNKWPRQIPMRTNRLMHSLTVHFRLPWHPLMQISGNVTTLAAKVLKLCLCQKYLNVSLSKFSHLAILLFLKPWAQWRTNKDSVNCYKFFKEAEK